MDDQQFGGRTDDDLFADDFEPVEPTKTPDQTPVERAQASQSIDTVQPGVAQHGDQAPSSSPLKAPAAAPTKGASSTPGRRARSSRAKAGGGAPKAAASDATHPKQQQPQKPSNSHPPAPAIETHKAPPPPSLAQSRHYQPPQPATTPATPTVVAAEATPGAQQKKNRNGNANTNRETPAKKRENGAFSSPVPNGDVKAGEQQKQEPAANKKPNVNAKATRGKANDAPKAPAGPANTPKATQGSGKNTGNGNGNGNGNNNAGGNGTTPKAAAAGNAAVKPNGARTQSGANPRSKLTEAELNAKMEAMRIASAEKARLFEQAQRDELDHERAVARGMDEARKRKAADEERRKRAAEEDKRRRAIEDEKRRKAAQETKVQDEERARNRERKLKALGAKEGNWDAGKDAAGSSKPLGSGAGAGAGAGGMQASRHSHAGILPVPNATVVTASAVERTDADHPVDEFRIRGRGGRGRNGGRGGGRGGGRRGGRPVFDDVYGNGADVADWVNGQPDPSAMVPPHGESTPELSQEAFPTLSGGAERPAAAAVADSAKAGASTPEKPKEQARTFSAVASSPAKVPLPALQPLSPAVGDWADEVEVATMDQTLRQ